jgi:hypothetical protein
MEVWRDVKGWEGLYQVSDHGRIRSLDHTVKTKTGKDMLVRGVIKKPSRDVDGYAVVSLQHKHHKKSYSVHRLVAQAFIPNPENKPEVNHINAVKDDNAVSNLEWVTGEENNQHAMDNGLMTKGHTVLMDGVAVFDSIRKCAAFVGVDPHEIRKALSGEYKTVHGHTFQRI